MSPANIRGFVQRLWRDTWDLVEQSRRGCAERRAQLITTARLQRLVKQLCADKHLDGPLMDRLTLRARKMIETHRQNGVFVRRVSLRHEVDDVELAFFQAGDIRGSL